MRKKILVVEEAPGAAGAFVNALVRAQKYDIRRATAGPSAVCRAHEFDPHLVIAEGAQGHRVAQTLGWVTQVPSVLLADGAVQVAATLPAARQVLPIRSDEATCLKAVEDLLDGP